ncbi:MAG: hypothetical protein IJP18_05845 [Oscillospiraceae bacterium]|nr:hypothetical protein [Oscillospiraceae bacterium]MBQ9982070.1 hypothetical protein [Oscillospiraceae bacterium]
MSIIYNECLGNTKLVYSAFAEENKETNSNIYGISVKDNNKNSEVILRNFTSIKENAIDFIETLMRNTVSPDFVKEIAEDYLLA